MNEKKTCLGIELGSTRIKAVAINSDFQPVSSGDYTWASRYENGVWTYPLEEVWTGLKTALSQVEDRENIAAAGVSAMMHGYLAFDKEWNLLTPFRTWQNTITGQAAAELTALFGFNIPQRWSIAHIYQAVLNKEEHVPKIAHITTLAGYIHYMLTGVNAVGVGEASGMFPIDSGTQDYDQEMVKKFDALVKERDLPWTLTELLPRVLAAGQDAGKLTGAGAAMLDGLPRHPLRASGGRRGNRDDCCQRGCAPDWKRLCRDFHFLYGGPGKALEKGIRGNRPGDHPDRKSGGHGPLQQLHQR